MTATFITYEQMEELLQQNKQIAEAMKAMAAQLKYSQKKWLTKEETALELGSPPTRTGQKKLKYLRDHGYLTIYGNTNPYTYYADEVRKIAKRIVEGEIYIPKNLSNDRSNKEAKSC